MSTCPPCRLAVTASPGNERRFCAMPCTIAFADQGTWMVESFEEVLSFIFTDMTLHGSMPTWIADHMLPWNTRNFTCNRAVDQTASKLAKSLFDAFILYPVCSCTSVGRGSIQTLVTTTIVSSRSLPKGGRAVSLVKWLTQTQCGKHIYHVPGA